MRHTWALGTARGNRTAPPGGAKAQDQDFSPSDREQWARSWADPWARSLCLRSEMDTHQGTLLIATTSPWDMAFLKPLWLVYCSSSRGGKESDL